MNIICKRCGAELELPDEYCENGAHFKCYECGTRFSYFNGEGVELKDSAPIRIPLPASKQRGCRGVPGQYAESKAGSVFLRVGRWWGNQTKMSRVVLKIVVGIVLTLVAISGIRSCKSVGKNEFEKDFDKIVRLEKKYGTNSMEYIEARIELIRNWTLPMQRAMVEEHKTFKNHLSRAGYMIMNTRYSNYELETLCIVDTNTGMSGFMKRALSADEFSYPGWLSAGDARAIWQHYYHEAVYKCEYNLTKTEELIGDLEERLKRLRSR